MKHSFLLKQTVLFATLFGVSGAITYYLCYRNYTPQSTEQLPTDNPNTPLKPSEVLFTSLMSLNKFNIDANLEFTYQQDMTHGCIDIQGVADVSDLSNLKISGDLFANYGASSITGSLGYFDETIYVDYNQSHLKLEQADLFDFIDMLPSMGVNISMPEEIKTLDLNDVTSKLSNMEPTSCPDGYMFELALNETISVFFKSDFNYQFTGLRTNKFFYDDLFVFLDCDISSENVPTDALLNPETIEGAPTYQSFRPAFNLINGFYNLFQNKNNTFGLNVSLDKQTLNGLENVISINGDLSYDLTNNAASFDIGIDENNRHHQFGLYLKNNTLFINQADINKLSIQNQTTSNLIDYLLNQISDDTIKTLLDDLTTTMSGPELSNLIANLENLNSWIVAIDVLEDKISITIDLSVFGLQINQITIYASIDYQTLLGIHLDDYEYNGYIVNVDIDVKPFNLVSPVTSEYVALDPAMELVPTIFNLINQEQFRLEFNGEVTSSSEEAAPVSINGGLQFDVLDTYGYGEVTIVDQTNYTHNLKADYRQDKTLLFAYNQTLRGKLDGAAIDDIYTMVGDIINNKDDHFMELFGDILQKISETPLYQALNGDIGILFATNTFSNIQITPTTIDLDLSGALIGLDCIMHLTINYDSTHLYGIEFSNINFNNTIINFNINLTDFDPSLESTRLDPMNTYFDFSDIKLLLSLGINTAEFNDYRLVGKANLNILGIIDKDLPIDLRIKNNQGNVSLSLDLTDIPIVGLANGDPDYTSTKSRTASIYYRDGLVYLRRTDRVSNGIIFTTQYDVNYTSVCQLDYFMDNIMYYLCEFVMGLRSWVMDQIQSSNTSANGQIRYETILKDFYYKEQGSYFFIDINIAELAQNPDLQSLTVKVRVNSETAMLSGLDINLNISVGITIKISASLDLVDVGSEVDLTVMDTFIAAHCNDEINTVIKTATKI